MATVGVAGGVGVVLEQEDDAADALLAETGFGGDDEVLQDPLAGLVVYDEVADRVAFGRRVLGVATHVQVQPGAVLEEHVGGASPRHDPAEQVARHFVWAQAALPPEGAGNAVLVLKTEDSSFHVLVLSYS